MKNTPCITCGQPWPDEATQVENILTKHVYWDAWAVKGTGVNATISTQNGPVEVEVIAASVLEEERNHGGDIQAMIIFLVDGVLYRKLGVTNSYGSTDWNGPFTQVTPKTQKIKAWERA